MQLAEPAWTLGIEEEYLLVDKESRDLVADPPKALMDECVRRLGDRVSPELMRAQIEVGTPPCKSVAEAGQALAGLRAEVAEVAAGFGCAPMAASTHPFATWHEQKQTDKARYSLLAKEMQATARRLLICGMHVHVGVADAEFQIDLMSQLAYFLPHLLALSCSSPFWEGEDTGLKSYRLTVFDAVPRTGLPGHFASHAEYQRHIQTLVAAGQIEDASMIWWDIRPSARYPTLETRIMDVMTDLRQALSLTALVQCLMRMLYRLRRQNQRWRIYSSLLVNENRWRAMRHSFDEGLIDFAKGEVVPYPDLLEELIALVAEDAQALGCEAEIAALRNILKDGTSAHNQLAVFHQAQSQGASQEAALRQVVDWLVAQTANPL